MTVDLSDLQLLQRGGTFFPLPPGDKDPPPPGMTGKAVNYRLNATQRRALHGKPGDNMGLLLGHLRVEMPDGTYRGVFVIDEDNKPAREKNGKLVGAQNGVQTIYKLEELLGPLPRTLTSLTPGLGKHRLFWAHERIVDLPAKILRRDPRFREDCGVEILTEGRYIVYPGSRLDPEIAIQKGYVPGTYRWEDPTVSIAELPTSWVDYLLELKAPEAEVQTYVGDITDPKELSYRRERYADYLKHVRPAVEGGGGDAQLFEVVQFGAYDLALPNDSNIELIAEHYNPRCQPPWGDDLEDSVLRKAHYSNTSTTRERKTPLLQSEFELLDQLPKTSIPVPYDVEAPKDDFGFKIRRGGWSEEPVIPRFLVDGLLVENKVHMIFAEPGTIKTWTAIDLAAAVSGGHLWLNERQTIQGTVLYVDFEDGEYEFHRRIRILTDGEDRPNLWYLYAPGPLNEWTVWERLISLQKQHNISFLVIDTLAGATPGVDENDRNAATPLQFAGRFTEATPATVLFLHHANRSGDIRGTSAFKANVDVLFRLDSTKDADGVHKAKLVCAKSGQKKVPTISLELSDAGLKQSEPPAKPEGETGGEAEKGDRRTLQELKAEVLLTIEQHGPFASKEMIRGIVKAKATSVSAVMAELEAAGDIVKTEEGWIRDSERLRKERIREVVRSHPDWGRGKLIAHACVKGDQFDRWRQLGLLVARSSDLGIEGFLWIDQS